MLSLFRNCQRKNLFYFNLKSEDDNCFQSQLKGTAVGDWKRKKNLKRILSVNQLNKKGEKNKLIRSGNTND